MTMTATRAGKRGYEDIVRRALNSRSRHWYLLNQYGNGASAYTITWMVENGKGLRAFEKYPPGTFEAMIRGENEVWFRRTV